MEEKKESEDNLVTNAKTCALVDKHFKEAAKYREAFEPEWRECEEFYNGNHWKDKNRTYKNIIFPLIEQEMSMLTDSLPGTDVLATRPEHDDAAKALESAIHAVYEQQNLQLKQVMAVRSSLKTGNGYQYVDFDPDADNGQGSVIIKNIPWEHVYLDPAATSLDEAGFVGIKFPIRIAELARRFPKFKNQIKPESVDEGFMSGLFNRTKEDRDNNRTQSGHDAERYKLDGMTEYEEAWIRDFEMVAIPPEETAAEIEKETEQFFNGINPDIGRHEDHVAHIEAHNAQIPAIAAQFLGIDPSMVTPMDIENLRMNDEQFAQLVMLIEDHNKIHEQYHQINPEGNKPKYSSGLRLVIKTGKTILYDGSAPVEDGMVPLVDYLAYKEESSIYAFGEIKNLLSSQKSYNEMDFAQYTALHLTSNPGWVIDNNCGIKPESISNKIGKVYTINPGTNFRRLEPGQVSPELEQRKQADARAMYDISGINEASQGKANGSITAARAIESLQQTASGRIRLKASQLALYSMPRLGKLVASRIVKYYTTERAMRFTDSSTGEVQRFIFSPEMVKDLDYDIRVVPGTLAGTDKAALYNAMMTLVERGLITAKTFFSAVDVPFKKKILEDLEATDQMNQQLQLLAQENEQLKAVISGVPPQDAQVPPQPTQGQIV